MGQVALSKRIGVTGAEDIGLYGRTLHSNGRLYPAYQLLCGGQTTEQGTRLARPVTKNTARGVTRAVFSLLEFYRANRYPSEGFSAFVDRVGLETLRHLLAEFAYATPASEDIWNFIDWDSTRMYILQRGEGECAV